MVTVIFPAAGQSKRMNSGVNKIFLKLSDKPILIHTLLTFSRCDEIDNLIVSVDKEEVRVVETLLKTVPHLKPYKIVIGGSERQYSIANAIRALDEDADIVLVHDAARPLVSRETIVKTIASVKEYGTGVVAVHEKNTIKIVDEDRIVQSTPARGTLWSVQTPQGFKREILEAAYEKAEKDDFLGTDDSSLVERLGIVDVHIVEGDQKNIKITTPEDMVIAEAFLREGLFSSAVGKAMDVVSGAAELIKRGLSRT